ncbi:hypothetical protein jhhlp_002904 [Lomentospora prolificans]|uniref:Major facilitator superfamily (MFS) profile domain-containing protein n=1 Tax=Lomentospora prolificans TaxID=41688 RepID=A0A2N3NFD4_9PEZI|nr:hypothetical protein jhhlp_002904 [Lomentospora prolificans]
MSDQSRPWGFHWRAKPGFILTTVGVGLFTDLLLYGIVVPVLPFMLRDRIQVPEQLIQPYTSELLAIYAAASVLFSVPAGWIADKLGSRQPAFLTGLILLFTATAMLAFARSIEVLTIARSAQGMSAALVWTTGSAMVQGAVEPGEMGDAFGTIMPLVSIAELLGPVMGGILYDKGGTLAVFGTGAGILFIDMVLRFLVIDNVAAAKYYDTDADRPSSKRTPQGVAGPSRGEATEEDHLLLKDDIDMYKIHDSPGRLVHAIPIIYCFRDTRLVAAMFLSFVQASVMGIFNATVPIEAEELFHFSSRESGLLFVALVVPYLTLGRAGGMAVDRYGTKAAATIGYAFLVPCLLLLGLPSQEIFTGASNVFLFCAVLVLNGVGLSIVSSAPIVEASNVTQKYHEANPGFFGENGPFAQLYGFNSLFFFTGLTFGPIFSGVLRVNFGYAYMAMFFAGLSGVTAMVSYLAIGDRNLRA